MGNREGSKVDEDFLELERVSSLVVAVIDSTNTIASYHIGM